MEQIPDLYKRINTSTIPKIIIDELKTNSNEFTKCYEWDSNNIEIEKIIGKDLPLFINFTGIYNFFINDVHYSHLERMLIKGICFDENFNKINCDNIYDYLEPYNRGFIKGYFEFESSLKKDNNIFNVSNEMLSYNIYSRIKRDKMMSNKSGGFKYCTFDQNTKDVFEKIKKENNLKSILLLTEENIFQSGFEGGEFYKAWELILNNPTLFEPIFLANAKTENQTEPEAIESIKKDLTTEKWFKTGIALATGEAFEIYRKLGANNPTEICRKIDVPTSNKTYISATLTDKDDNKNLFKYPNKLKALHKEITEKGLKFGTEFLAKYNQIEPD